MDDYALLVRTILWTCIAGVTLYWSCKIWNSLHKRYVIRKTVKKHWPSRPYHWFWGHADLVEILRNEPEKLLDMITGLSESFSHGTGLFLGPAITLLRVIHRKIFRNILGASEEKFPKSESIYQLLHPWLGSKGLLLLSGKEWQRHRHLLSNSFHFSILRPYVVKMNECSAVLVEKWKSKIPDNKEKMTVEVFRDFSLMTIDAIMKCLMGVECNSQVEEGIHREYVLAIHKISSLVVDRMRARDLLARFDFYYNRTEKGREMAKLVKIARGYSESVITSRREEYKNGASVGGSLGSGKRSRRHFDFLDVLLQARNPDGNPLSNKEISDEVNTFIFEGHDTTTSAISWTCYCLACNPEFQTRCYDEIMEVLNSKDEIDLDDLGQLKFTMMCIKESLRLYPPVPSIARKPTSDLEIDGMPIKSGTEVILSIIGIHYDAANWPDPRKFDPFRFSPENTTKRDPYTYVPFSAGPRNCIGQNFAMNEIKVCLVHVLRSFEMSVDENNLPIPVVELILRTKAGLHLRVKKRLGV